jgi:hypothetical protein
MGFIIQLNEESNTKGRIIDAGDSSFRGGQSFEVVYFTDTSKQLAETDIFSQRVKEDLVVQTVVRHAPSNHPVPRYAPGSQITFGSATENEAARLRNFEPNPFARPTDAHETIIDIETLDNGTTVLAFTNLAGYNEGVAASVELTQFKGRNNVFRIAFSGWKGVCEPVATIGRFKRFKDAQ